ncbi:MAG: protein kinase [Gemmatimonadales bacterium]
MSIDRLASALADRYTLQRELGQGGMATVYLAEDLKHTRQVAIKVLRPELAAVIGAERFLAEIRTTANLQHPHILPLHDSGEADSFLFYVMPFIEGETVRDRLSREKQLPIVDAVRIATEVAAALDYAHRRGVIHRDIKPENILLHDGSALVADFGIALAASRAGETRMTETGMSLGTPHYMSPEQAMGEREITARSDVYALGAVTYEMLLGEPPFSGPTAQAIVSKVLTEKPPPMVARRDRIPPQVEDAVLTALEKLPADRWGSAKEFAEALAGHGGTTARRDVTVAGRAAPGTRVLPGRPAAWIAALLLTAGLAAWGWLRPAPAPLFSERGRAQITFNGRSEQPAISPDGRFVAYLDRQCERGDWNPCTFALLVQEEGGARPVAVLSEAPFLDAPRWTHDGNALVVGGALDSLRSGVFVVPRLGGVPRQVGPLGVFDTHPTGDSVVVISRGEGSASPPQGMIIALGTGETVATFTPAAGDYAGVAWAPDGRHLAVTTLYAKVSILRRDGALVDSMAGPFRASVRWTPSGDAVVVFRALPVKEDDLDRIPVDRDGRFSGSPTVVLSKVPALLRGEFDLARQSGRLAFSTGSATFDLWTFELDGSDALGTRRTSGTTWYDVPVISPDGLRLYYIRGDAVGDNLYALTLPDAEEALTADPYPGFISAALSTRGDRLAFGHFTPGSLRISLLTIATRRIVRQNWPSEAEPLPFGDQGVIYIPRDGSRIEILDSLGASPRALEAPSGTTLFELVLSPDESEAAVWMAGPDGLGLGVTPLAAADFRVVYRLPPGAVPSTLSWTRGGRIHYAQWDLGEPALILRQIGATGGSPTTMAGSLPRACNTRYVRIAIAAPRGVCFAVDNRSDIWQVDLLGLAR